MTKFLVKLKKKTLTRYYGEILLDIPTAREDLITEFIKDNQGNIQWYYTTDREGESTIEITSVDEVFRAPDHLIRKVEATEAVQEALKEESEEARRDK